MSEPSEANSDIILMERSLKQCMVKAMEVEQRTRLLQTLVRLGLTTKEVKQFSSKQKIARVSKGRAKKSKSEQL